MGGLVHDYAYKYACLKRTGKGALLIVDQKRADEIFRDICIEVKFLHNESLIHTELRLNSIVFNNSQKKNVKVKQQ